jgi:hypothetical protein
MMMTKILISQIKLPFGPLRNPQSVARYAAMLRVSSPPPVVLWHYRSTQYRFFCEDGRHRVAAAVMAGHKFIEAKIMDGAIEFYHHPSGPLCHRLVPFAEATPPAKNPRRPTKKAPPKRG